MPHELLPDLQPFWQKMMKTPMRRRRDDAEANRVGNSCAWAGIFSEAPGDEGARKNSTP